MRSRSRQRANRVLRSRCRGGGRSGDGFRAVREIRPQQREELPDGAGCPAGHSGSKRGSSCPHRLSASQSRLGGAIVTNANCSATVAAVALAPLHQRFGIRQLFLSTMQAVSGAGYPGVASLDILGNVIPYISDEEPKLEREMLKLLGTYGDDVVSHADRKSVV